MSSGTGLSGVGLDRLTEAVYRTMLVQPRWGVTDLSLGLGCSEARIRSALDRLAELNLLRVSIDDGDGDGDGDEMIPVSPDFGLRLLLNNAQRDLLNHQQRFADTEAAVLRLIDESTQNSHGRHEIERLEGVGAIRARLAELTHGCVDQCLSFMPGGAQSAASRAASHPLDEILIERNVATYTLYLDSVRNDSATYDYAAWLTAHGGQVRTVPVLPVRMVLFDGTVAVVPTDPEDTKQGAVQLCGRGVMAALTALFWQVWDNAKPFGVPGLQDRDDQGLTGQETELLKLLAQGHTDEVAARRLGVGLRTVRRMMSELMGRLEARSRFEAGFKAAERGWIELR